MNPSLSTFPQQLAAGVRQLDTAGLNDLAGNIRAFLLDSVARTGGHIGANLGTIEITLAIHHVFNVPSDRVVFDTGHQGYTHKLLTGRIDAFATLNTYRGMSRFLSRAEHEADVIEASHAGTSLSLAAGLAWQETPSPAAHTVAVIGDGSLVEGLAFEALNFLPVNGRNLVVVLNDNGMAIAPNVGGIHHMCTRPDWQAQAGGFFRALGFNYLAVPDGHDLAALTAALCEAKGAPGPWIVHAKTEKGRGLSCASAHPYKMHFSMPFDVATGKGASPTVMGTTFASVAAEELLELMALHPEMVLITPATPYASYLDKLTARYPTRVIDVGMAEQHAVGLACGLALQGKHPIVCVQTTFLQRAYDQLIHDAAYMDLPITLLGVRSSFAGFDSATHHGIYDIPYLRAIPRLQIYYPENPADMRNALRVRAAAPKGPCILLHPYDPLSAAAAAAPSEPGDTTTVAEGDQGAILCVPNQAAKALALREKILAEGGPAYGVVAVRRLKPLPADAILAQARSKRRLITLEESNLPGGFGSAVLEILHDHDVLVPVFRAGVPDMFVQPGSNADCSLEAGLDVPSIYGRLKSRSSAFLNTL